MTLSTKRQTAERAAERMPSEAPQKTTTPPFLSHADSLPATLSDPPSCTPTDRQTVMAEQSGHNVVSKSQSTSGSPLVDVAATTSTAHAALSGTETPNTAETTIAQTEFSKPAAESATDNNPPARQELAGSDATKHAAEPSAGDVANVAANDLAQNPLQAEEKQSISPDLVNGIRDDASQGDMGDDRSTADVSVDVSINSDTDNSRGDASEKKG